MQRATPDQWARNFAPRGMLFRVDPDREMEVTTAAQLHNSCSIRSGDGRATRRYPQWSKVSCIRRTLLNLLGPLGLDRTRAMLGIKMNFDQTHPVLRDVPIGISAAGQRRNRFNGRHQVSATDTGGAAQRSLVHFALETIGCQKRLSRLQLCEKSCGTGECRGRPARRMEGRGHRRAAVGNRRQARRTLSSMCGKPVRAQSNMNVSEVLSSGLSTLGEIAASPLASE